MYFLENTINKYTKEKVHTFNKSKYFATRKLACARYM